MALNKDILTRDIEHQGSSFSKADSMETLFASLRYSTEADEEFSPGEEVGSKSYRKKANKPPHRRKNMRGSR